MPQPANRDWQALPSHPGVCPRERKPPDPSLGDPVQQDLPRPRQPKTVRFTINDKDANDEYARLFADDVVDAIAHLNLPL